MVDQITRLWRGEESLARAFWDYAILYGTLANLIATAGTFAALVAGLSGGVALAIHVLPIPYNVFVAIAVWRSAGRFQGGSEWALLARISVTACAAITCLA